MAALRIASQLYWIWPLLLCRWVQEGVVSSMTPDFSSEHRREFERLREQAKEQSAGLWGACSDLEVY